MGRHSSHDRHLGRVRVNRRDPFYDPRMFAPALPLTAAIDDISIESSNLLEQLAMLRTFSELSPQEGARRLAGSDWKVFYLRYFGREIQGAALICPRTAAVLADYPEVVTAAFSILGPGTALPPHRGPTSAFVRLHLTVTSEGDAAAHVLEVGTERRELSQGDMVAFNDRLMHCSSNGSGSPRVALLVDVVRPAHPLLDRALRGAITAAGHAHPGCRAIIRRSERAVASIVSPTARHKAPTES
jgi:beta-hydroxylase